MGYAVAIHFGKLLVWDKVLAMGTTDPLADGPRPRPISSLRSTSLKRGFENIARIVKK